MEITTELEQYIERHIDAEPELLYDLNRQSHIRLLAGRMASGHWQGRLLKMLVRMINPRAILELGTFTGYSALSMAEGLIREDSWIDTVEIDDELEPLIREFLDKSPYGARVRLHIGAAEEVVERLGGEWDMVFIDANKRNYPENYKMCMKHIPIGGYIIADNILWDGKVVGPIPKEDAAQTKAIREFNDIVANDERVEKVILPLRDGLTIIRRIK
ncbi:MAG: class I SAM-dependent methyltransferase [Marinilabiliaceae bacterium]|nr:class I SAM-dependent methyltransferase [Marinilabiliaceae bacterium]